VGETLYLRSLSAAHPGKLLTTVTATSIERPLRPDYRLRQSRVQLFRLNISGYRRSVRQRAIGRASDFLLVNWCCTAAFTIGSAHQGSRIAINEYKTMTKTTTALSNLMGDQLAYLNDGDLQVGRGDAECSSGQQRLTRVCRDGSTP
jgi:hypothetical protein